MAKLDRQRESIRRTCRCQGEAERADTRHRGEKAVAQAVWQGAKSDHSQNAQAIAPQHLPERDKAVILSDEAVDISREDAATGEEGGGAAGYRGRCHDRPSPGEAIHKSSDGYRRRVADHGREGAYEGQEPDQQPAGWEFTP